MGIKILPRYMKEIDSAKLTNYVPFEVNHYWAITE